MNATAAVAVVGALAAAALGIKMAVDAKRPQGPDPVQIQRMLFEGERAAESGNAAGVNRYISDSYRDSLGMSDSSLRYQIAGYLRERRQLDVSIPSQSIQVALDPGERTGTVRFHLIVNAQGPDGRTASEMDLTLKVAKEKVHYYWVFPGEEWRITSAEGYTALD